MNLNVNVDLICNSIVFKIVQSHSSHSSDILIKIKSIFRFQIAMIMLNSRVEIISDSELYNCGVFVYLIINSQKFSKSMIK